jgi:hypothetical protein
MGGMFSVVKVREGIAAGDYKDPGWFKHPPGTVAYEFAGAAPAPARKSDPPSAAPARGELKVIKPGVNSRSHGKH